MSCQCARLAGRGRALKRLSANGEARGPAARKRGLGWILGALVALVRSLGWGCVVVKLLLSFQSATGLAGLGLDRDEAEN